MITIKDIQLKNIMEDIVEDVYNDLLKTNLIKICNCPKCHADVLAIVLNNIKPKYVVTEKGEAIERTNELRDQIRVDVLEQLLKAVEIVSKNPHHNQNDVGLI
ncbi:hypothetical protein OSSY52_11990 [Tepiditoga spiralis]|uniref:Competence protein ComFB n=1 Tax=Tepiditoga spiralis TaxID=2108365 RepID=A0A7G1G3P1_9BACT|nr:late competence development ComFB family protein [Tepiditoga spiralis]BBE31058.1 hypothetical protein OSSY52_11990 [Tepiditoga spiralis]